MNKGETYFIVELQGLFYPRGFQLHEDELSNFHLFDHKKLYWDEQLEMQIVDDDYAVGIDLYPKGNSIQDGHVNSLDREMHQAGLDSVRDIEEMERPLFDIMYKRRAELECDTFNARVKGKFGPAFTPYLSVLMIWSYHWSEDSWGELDTWFEYHDLLTNKVIDMLGRMRLHK
jgi:hypothetical protein